MYKQNFFVLIYFLASSFQAWNAFFFRISIASFIATNYCFSECWIKWRKKYETQTNKAEVLVWIFFVQNQNLFIFLSLNLQFIQWFDSKFTFIIRDANVDVGSALGERGHQWTLDIHICCRSSKSSRCKINTDRH